MNKKRAFLILTACALLGTIIGLVVKVYRQSLPVYTFGTGVPDVTKHGNPEYAEKRARELLVLYKQVNGDVGRMGGLDNLRLPDQRMAEVPDSRAANTSAWSFPYSCKAYDDVAFFTDLYARRNIKYFRGDKSESHPAGFFIVAWKNGKVERVPVSSLRLIPYGNQRILGWPGMPGYSSSLPAGPWSKG